MMDSIYFLTIEITNCCILINRRKTELPTMNVCATLFIHEYSVITAAFYFDGNKDEF